MEPNQSLYDQNDYYQGNSQGSRLSSVLDLLLNWLDRRRARGILKKTGMSSGSVLDVGAGNGSFLNSMREQGFEVFGTTASQNSARATQERFGIKIDYTDDEIPGRLLNKKFDLITYWHVFEHLISPQQHAESASQCLGDNGTLIIEVPNPEALGSQICFRSWLGSDEKHHINMMTEEELFKLFTQQGLKLVRKETFSLKFTYVYLWSALLGFCFPGYYQFDWIMDLLKSPMKMFVKSPLLTLNACFAVIYFFPAILVLALKDLAHGSGEVLRLYFKKDQDVPG